MSYSINLTNGTTLVPGGLSDGTIDTTHSSITLIGRDYAGYGQFLNENFVYMLENFANGSGPANPLKGQLWWDTTNNILRVWSGSSWKISTGATSEPYSTPPSDLSSLGGDLWFDSTNQQLKVYSGTSWITVGPAATPATGNTGVTPALMTDTSSGTHQVIQFLVAGTVYAIFSKDTFTTNLSGFSQIVSGLNFSTTVTGLNTANVSAVNNTIVQRDNTASINAYNVSATGTVTAGAVVSSSFTAPSGLATFTGNLAGNVSGTYVSATSVTAQGVTASSGFQGTVLTATQNSIQTMTGLATVIVGGTTTLTGTATLNGNPISTVGGSASFSSINATPVGNATPSTGAFTSVTVSANITPVANTVSNIGSISAWFNNVYAATFTGTAVHAQYADLAERFAADAEYPAGTVVEMGGPAEITKVGQDLSDQVFGVISTNAAYLMNSSAGTDSTHPPIAVNGRVPVRVIGQIRKGDRLVSAGNGLARAGKRSEITPWNVIGRSLENKNDLKEGIIEASVKLNS